ncbi:hypothetical protein [Erwinia billingiae]|uniref:hypothetical protein n=1 Tax=Erwinia billingiae TaxID=182337 RepID=UPI0022481917|nr:hypothetical protein [Erwinia billingiae]MCX0500350.1 hypothetical protein [Erwinia billingiae]
MFSLYRYSDIEWELTPEDYPFVLSPDRAMDRVKKHYDLEPSHYSHFGAFELTTRLFSNPQTWQRARAGYADRVYDMVKDSLQIGWLIGIDPMEEWNSFDNPFYVDENGDLVCERPHWYDDWYVREVTDGYNDAVAKRNDVKALPTQRIHYGSDYEEPEQHAQAAGTINSKAAGRLLAAGGIYNGNIEDFAKTAQQLGGDAPAGFNQVLNKTTAGTAIAVTSVAAGLGLGRLGAVGVISQIEKRVPEQSLLASGGIRANKFSGNWPTAELDAAVTKFTGNEPVVTMTNSGKRIYTHPETGVQVVEDLSGRYFRINNPALSGKRTYLDLDGLVPNNKTLENGKQIGRNQSEYNEVTHFNISGGE